MQDPVLKPEARTSWLSRRLLQPIVTLLKSGLTVDEIARSLALGCTTGLSPLIGTTTVTSSALALALKLNPVAALTANYAVYPAQILLILPFARLGRTLTGWKNLPLSLSQLRTLMAEEGLAALQTLGSTMANATLAWLVCAPVIFVSANVSSKVFLHRWKQTRHGAGS